MLFPTLSSRTICMSRTFLFRIGVLSKVNYTISQENFDTKTGLKRISLENSEINP